MAPPPPQLRLSRVFASCVGVFAFHVCSCLVWACIVFRVLVTFLRSSSIVLTLAPLFMRSPNSCAKRPKTQEREKEGGEAAGATSKSIKRSYALAGSFPPRNKRNPDSHLRVVAPTENKKKRAITNKRNRMQGKPRRCDSYLPRAHSLRP